MLSTDRFEKNLAGTGVGLDQIDYVMCTHLHVDHVGWNTRLENGRWVPTFPNARYVFADTELAHWTEVERQDPSAAPWITNSVLPIIAAQRQEVVTSAHQFNDVVQSDSDTGAYDRPLFGPSRQARRGCGHHRRYDPLALTGALSGTRHESRLQFAASRRVAPETVRRSVRYVNAGLYGTFSVAVVRPDHALG